MGQITVRICEMDETTPDRQFDSNMTIRQLRIKLALERHAKTSDTGEKVQTAESADSELADAMADSAESDRSEEFCSTMHSA